MGYLRLSPDHFSLYLIQMHLVFIIGSHSWQDKSDLLNASIFIKNTNEVLEQIIFRCTMKHKIVVVKKYEQLMKSSDPCYRHSTILFCD